MTNTMKQKVDYSSPQSKTVELDVEQVIATSGVPDPWRSINEEEW